MQSHKKSTFHAANAHGHDLRVYLFEEAGVVDGQNKTKKIHFHAANAHGHHLRVRLVKEAGVVGRETNKKIHKNRTASIDHVK